MSDTTGKTETIHIGFKDDPGARVLKPEALLATPMTENGSPVLTMTLVVNDVAFTTETIEVTEGPEGRRPSGPPRYNGNQVRVREGTLKLTPQTAVQMKRHVDNFLAQLPAEIRKAMGINVEI